MYLFLFKTNVSKIIKALVVLVVSILAFLVFDTVKYPNRVYNEEAYAALLDINEDIGFNPKDIYMVDKNYIFEYKNKSYISFNMYDLESMYYVIFNISKSGDYVLSYVYKLDNKEQMLYTDNSFDKFNNINPIIFIHLIRNNQDYILDDVDRVEVVQEEDLFLNTKVQEIYMTNGDSLYVEFSEFGVSKVKMSDNSIDEQYDINYLVSKNFKTVNKLILKRFGDDYKIVGYNYYDSIHGFNLITEDGKYVVEYTYGYGASLEYITNEKQYKEFLSNFYD